jgi:hypothetical protein
VEVYWKANLSVTWLSDSSSVVDAEITITDAEDNVDEREFSTDGDGMVKDFYIMEYYRDNQAKHNSNPYWFNATMEKDGKDIWNFTQGDIEDDQVNNFDIVLDDVAPPLVIQSPEDGFITNQTSFTLEGWTEPNVTAERPITVEVKLGGAIYKPVVLDTGDFSTEVNLPTDATHTIDVRSYDFVLNEIEDSIQVTRDTKVPALTIDTPEDETLTNITSIEVAGTTEAGATLTVNEEPVTVDSGGEYSTMVGLEEGENIITVRSMDIAQNWQQKSVMVELDTKLPILIISEPADGHKTNEPNIRVIGTTENKASVKINNENVLVAGTSFQAFMDLTEGENIISVMSCDIAGNCNTTVLHVFLDTQPPSLTITEPEDDLLTREANIVVKGTTEAGTTVMVNGRDVDLIGIDFSYDYELREGKNSIKVESEDEVGNKISITRTVYLDTRPPDIIITSPEKGLTTNSVTISVEGTTEADATLKVNDNTVALSGTMFTADVKLEEGENTITITATDLAGNTNSEDITVNLDTTVLLEVKDLVEGGEAIETTDETFNISGTADEDATVVVNDLIVTTDRKGNWKKEVDLEMGENTIVVEANDPLGNGVTKEYKVVRKEKPAPPPPGPIGGGDSLFGNLMIPLLIIVIVVVIIVVVAVMSRKKKAGDDEEKKEEVQPTVDQPQVQPAATPPPPTTYEQPQSYGNGNMQPGYGYADQPQQQYGYGDVESHQMYEQGGYYQGGYVQEEQVESQPSMAYGYPITPEAQDILDRATRAIDAAEERGEDVSKMKRHMKIANAFASKGNSEKTIHYSQKALDAYQS